jgi:hypothetical protein
MVTVSDFGTRLARFTRLLTSLQTLNLLGCGRLSGDLSPLADLTSLQSLGLSQRAEKEGERQSGVHRT